MSSLAGRFTMVAALALAIGLSAGCGGPSTSSGGSEPADEERDVSFTDDEIKGTSDAQVKAEIEAAAEGAIYVSESDSPFFFVAADLGTKLSSTRAITEELVRTELASFVDDTPDADKPLATLFAMSETFASWKENAEPDSGACSDEYSSRNCKLVARMNAALTKNLRDVRVFYFGADGAPGSVQGVAVTVFVVGRTPSGNLAGVRALAIWT